MKPKAPKQFEGGPTELVQMGELVSLAGLDERRWLFEWICRQAVGMTAAEVRLRRAADKAVSDADERIANSDKSL